MESIGVLGTADGDRFVDIGEASQITNVPRPTLRYWRQRNEGPASFRMGKRVVYRLSEIQRWIAEREEATSRGGVIA